MVLNQAEPRAFNARGSTLTAEVRNVGDGAVVSAKGSALSLALPGSNSSDMSMYHSSSDSSDAGNTAASSGRLGLSELIDLIRSQGVEEGVASDEDVELVFSKHASAGTGGKIDVEAVGELMHELLGVQDQNEDPVSKRPQFETLGANAEPHATRECREMHSRHSASTTSSDRQRLIEQQERVYRLSLDSSKGGEIQPISESKLKFNASSPDPAPIPLAQKQATAARPMPSFLRSSSDLSILISTGKRPQQPSEVRGFDISVTSKDSGSSLDSSERESFESSFDTSQASAQPPHRHAEPLIGQEFASEIRPGHSGGQKSAFVSGLQGRYVGRASFDDILRDAHSTFQSAAGFRSGHQNDTSQATSHASESVDDAESLQQALQSAYRAQLESLDGPQGARDAMQGEDASAPGSRGNLFNVITESMAPALSFAVKQADELREENRRLRDDNQRLRSLLGSNKTARNGEPLSLLQDKDTEGLLPLPAVRGGEWHAAPGVEPGETSEDGDTRAALIKDIVDLQEQLADAQQELDIRDQQLKKAQESVNSLTAEKEALEAERGSFVQEHGALFESELQAALQSAEEAREEMRQQKIHAEEQTSLRVRAERDEQKAKELMQDMENEFLQYKHMTSEAKSRADASAADLEAEVTALRTEFAVMEDKSSTMQADLLQALTRLKASEAMLADTKSQLAAEKQGAIERFKVWEQELDERNSEVQKLEARVLHLQRQSLSADDADHLSPDGLGSRLELSGEHHARAASSSIAAHRGAAGRADDCPVEEGSGCLVGRDTERRVKLLEQVHAAQQEASLAKQQHELEVQQRQAAEVTAEELKRDLAACLVEVHRRQTLSARLSDENATLRQQLLEVRTPVGPANKDADIGEAVPDARTQNDDEHVTEQPAFEMPHQAETPPGSPTMQATRVSGASVGAAEEAFSREPRAATVSARRRAPPDDGSGREVRGDAETRLVMEGLKDAHTRMQEARQCLQTLETNSQGPLLEAHQLKLQLTRAHKERDEMEQVAVRDRQRVSELRQVIFGLQASSASLGIENERLKSSLADLQDRYESLVQTSANVRLGSLSCNGCSHAPGPTSAVAQVSDASQDQDVMLASSALPVSASWLDEPVRGAYEGMQRKAALLQAESEHEVTKRLQASCLLAQIVAQASPQALKEHAGMFSVGQCDRQARAGAPGSLAEVGADGIASGSNEMLPLPEQELLPRQDDEASGLNEWCLSLDNVDRAVRRMTPAQLKNAVEVVRRALVDGTRQRDAWRKSMWQVSVAEVERLHRWHAQVQEEALCLSLEREQLANERKMTSAFHAAIGPLLDNHRCVLQDALSAREARVIDSFADELLFLETALVSGSAASSDSRAHAHTASPGQPPVLGGNSKSTPRSTAVPTSDSGAAHRQDKAHEQAAGAALPDTSVGGGCGHARRQIPIGWALIECTCGKGFGTEEGLEAHLRQERGHGVATTMPGNGPRQGADSRLIDTLVSTYAAPASLAAASQALTNSAQAPLTLL